MCSRASLGYPNALLCPADGVPDNKVSRKCSVTATESRDDYQIGGSPGVNIIHAMYRIRAAFIAIKGESNTTMASWGSEKRESERMRRRVGG